VDVDTKIINNDFVIKSLKAAVAAPKILFKFKNIKQGSLKDVKLASDFSKIQEIRRKV